MLKKAMLGIVALTLLVGAENLLAKEKEEESKPKATQKQKQVQKDPKKKKGTQKQNSKAKRLSKKKAGKKTSPKRKKASQKKRRQKPAKEAEAKKAKAEKARAEKAKAEKSRAKKAKATAARKPMQSVRRKGQQSRPEANPPAQQMFGRWLDELTKAYREDDRKKMGQLIRKMHQVRQRVRQRIAATVGRRRGFRDRPDPDMQPPEDVVRPLIPGRGIGGRGRGFRGRGMGMGQGFPGSWCPWLQDPEP